MSAELTPVLKQRFFDFDGLPLAGGKLYSYVAGTTTLLATYTTQAGNVANANPVILDADGYANVWMLPTAYKFILRDSNDVDQFTVDNVLSVGQIATSDVKFSVVDGQSATILLGEAWDGLANTSIEYRYEGRRNNGTIANGGFFFQYDGTVWRIIDDGYNGDAVAAINAAGLTVTFVQTTTVGQLYLAASSGAGNGTFKVKKFPYSVNS